MLTAINFIMVIIFLLLIDALGFYIGVKLFAFANPDLNKFIKQRIERRKNKTKADQDAPTPEIANPYFKDDSAK